MIRDQVQDYTHERNALAEEEVFALTIRGAQIEIVLKQAEEGETILVIFAIGL